jgi:hypothetical protein
MIYFNDVWIIVDGNGEKASTNGTWIFVDEPYVVQNNMLFKAGQTLFKVNLVNYMGFGIACRSGPENVCFLRC